jgi:2-dehydropantoate 2-reductase
LPNGPLRETPATRALVETCMAEVAAVGRARGVALPDDAVASVMNLWDGLPAEMVASMSHDLKAGKPLELDHLSGAVVRLGQSLGVPTPTHAFLHAALQPYVNGAPLQ